jgi:hypothetical protein
LAKDIVGDIRWWVTEIFWSKEEVVMEVSVEVESMMAMKSSEVIEYINVLDIFFRIPTQ